MPDSLYEKIIIKNPANDRNKCPFCNEVLDYLCRNYTDYGDCTMQPDGDYDDWCASDTEFGSFKCPECGREFAISYDEAIDFLNGRITLDEYGHPNPDNI